MHKKGKKKEGMVKERTVSLAHVYRVMSLLLIIC